MMKKFDKRVVTIILLLIAGILICVYAIESRASVLFILISIIPFVIANRLLFFWDNKKGQVIFGIIGVTVVIVASIIRSII